MKLKFLELFNLYFHKVGDSCPKYQWDKFIQISFQFEEETKSKKYTQELLTKEYIFVRNKEIGECYEITSF